MPECTCGHEYEYHAPNGGECEAGCPCIAYEEGDEEGDDELEDAHGYSRSDLLFGGNWS